MVTVTLQKSQVGIYTLNNKDSGKKKNRVGAPRDQSHSVCASLPALEEILFLSGNSCVGRTYWAVIVSDILKGELPRIPPY